MFDVFYYNQKPNLFAHERQVSTLDEARRLSKTRYFWIVNYLVDYTGFDFLWEPKPWEANQNHIWPSQWQKDSGTGLYSKNCQAETNYNHTQLSRQPLPHKILIDHGNQELEQVVKQVSPDRIVRFFDNYLGTLLRIAATSDQDWIWITSSLCDYSEFDFSWHPDPWQQELLHVFASNDQRQGDTFLMPVQAFKNHEKKELLDWYALNYVDISVPRYQPEIYVHDHDSQFTAIKEHNQTTPITVYTTKDNVILKQDILPTISMWSHKTQEIAVVSKGAGIIVVPKRVCQYLDTQVYDYPYISFKPDLYKENPLDIIFISNGEANAEINWTNLNEIHSAKKLPNRLLRSDKIKGRVAAYHAAAKMSKTPWFFAVFAKLDIEWSFDWSWQPDRLQVPKHYIFHALNPVNGLIYGHQAMIAYNKKLVLANTGQGLDFTLDSEHEVVPIVSGIARYNTSPWSAWRTAFREVLKLKSNLPDVESEARIQSWLDTGWMEDGTWSQAGAQDAIEYYELVQGDFKELKKSYDWPWLASYAFIRRGLQPDL